MSLSCDVFSYGMVLFEIFAEEVPFAGIHDIKVANMILEGKVGCCVCVIDIFTHDAWFTDRSILCLHSVAINAHIQLALIVH